MMLSLPTLPPNLQANLHGVHERITKAARAAGRDSSSVRLLAVSKTFSAEAVLAAARAGQLSFGENYAQEAIAKMEAVADLAPELIVEWHFIGPIQSNKTRLLAERCDWVQSVDRLKVAERLSEQRPLNLPALNLLLQVNISGEASKGGAAPDELLSLAQSVVALPRLRLRGLMAVPAATDSVAEQRAAFRQMKQLFNQLRNQLRDEPGGRPPLDANPVSAFDTLSIGMSSDLEAAVAEGSTMVRVGTGIFGARAARQ